MIIIIDGYNVLKARLGKQYIKLEQRRTFVKQLASYAAKKQHTIMLIFDGEAEDDVAMHVAGVRIYYAGKNNSADDSIMLLLAACQSNNSILVTNDRALTTYAHQHDIATIASDLFYAKVVQSSKLVPHTSSSTVASKAPDHKSLPFVDELMMQSAEDIQDKDDVVPSARQSSGRMLSSREKKLHRLVKKL